MFGYQVYPTGFRTPLYVDPPTATQPDVEWCALYEGLQSGKYTYESWEFRAAVIRHTRRLFGGDFAGWMDAQVKNTGISNTAMEFLLDIMRFIETGSSHVDLSAYNTIFYYEREREQFQRPDAEHCDINISNFSDKDPDDFIYDWIQHRNGFNNMLCTVNFIFGTDPLIS